MKFLTIGFVILALVGCRSFDGGDSELSTDKKKRSPKLYNVDDHKQKRCVAIRGNGHYIVTHFGALAGITENYGAPDGLGGGTRPDPAQGW